MRTKIILTGLLGLALSGCATTQGRQSASQLQTRVGELEQEVASKDEEIKELQYTIKDLTYEVDRMKSRSSRTSISGGATSESKGVGTDDNIIRVNVDVKQIQSALKAAGYYNGNIDGKVGAQTRKAIASFQKDNGLKSDGILGQKTWGALKKYGQQ